MKVENIYSINKKKKCVAELTAELLLNVHIILYILYRIQRAKFKDKIQGNQESKAH